MDQTGQAVLLVFVHPAVDRLGLTAFIQTALSDMVSSLTVSDLE
jgi:hypothetical protein